MFSKQGAPCWGRNVPLVSLGWLLGLGAAFADAQTLSIRGSVSDASGASIPGATVSLTLSTVAGRRTTATDASGAYTFEGLPAGSYLAGARYNDTDVLAQPVTVGAGPGSDRPGLHRRSIE